MRLKPAIVFFFLAAGAAFAAPASDTFGQANAKYRVGDFKEAAELYHQLIDTGNAGSAVHYNLANSALRLGHKGQAMLHYERARKITPRDPDLLWNIRVLKDALTDRIEPVSRYPFLLPLETAKKTFTPDELAMLVSSALGILALCALLNFFFPVASAVWKFAGTLAVILALAWGILLGWQVSDSREPGMVVLDPQVSAYSGPSDSETKVFTLHEGAQGRMIDELNDWIYIELDNGHRGWIRKNSSEIV